MNNKDIKLSEVIDKMISFQNKEITADDLDKWCSNVVFYTKTTLRDKCIVINKILSEMVYNYDNDVDLVVQMEINKFWYGLIGLYTNIDITETDLLTEVNYNLLDLFFYDWAISYIEKDYNKFLKIFDEFFNYYFYKESFSGVLDAVKETAEFIQAKDDEFLNFVKEDKEVISDLSKIAMLGSQFNIKDNKKEEKNKD